MGKRETLALSVTYRAKRERNGWSCRIAPVNPTRRNYVREFAVGVDTKPGAVLRCLPSVWQTMRAAQAVSACIRAAARDPMGTHILRGKAEVTVDA